MRSKVTVSRVGHDTKITWIYGKLRCRHSRYHHYPQLLVTHHMLSNKDDLTDPVTFVGLLHHNHVRRQIIALGIVVYVYHLQDESSCNERLCVSVFGVNNTQEID